MNVDIVPFVTYKYICIKCGKKAQNVHEEKAKKHMLCRHCKKLEELQKDQINLFYE